MSLKGELMKSGFKLTKFMQDQAPIMLAAAACIGAGLTVYSAIKATPKAEKKKEEMPEDKKDDIVEEVKTVAPVYAETIILGGLTVTCIFGSAALSRKQQSTLLASYIAANRYWVKYKDDLMYKFGMEADEEIRHDIMDDTPDYIHPEDGTDEVLFYDENYVDDETGEKGKYFVDTLLHVHDTEYHFNRNLHLREYADWNEFYELLDNAELPPTSDGALRGFSLYLGEIHYGYHWVDFEHEVRTMDDGTHCIVIHTPFAPHIDYLDDRFA